jgi:hypothetical protein
MYGEGFFGPGVWATKEKYTELISKGQELWFYVCNANFPPYLGYDIDTKIGYEPRLLKWGAWYENATGFLFWSMTYWYEPSDPWHKLANLAQFGEMFSRNGDGILLYPGNHDGTVNGGSPEWVAIDGPVVSYRMKQIRDGLEDWEMLNLAAKLGAKEYARKQVSTVYESFGENFTDAFDIDNPPWTLDEKKLFEARKNIALKIQYLLHPEKYEDPEKPEIIEEESIEICEPAVEEEAEIEQDQLTLDMVEDQAVSNDTAVQDIQVETSIEKESKKSSSGCNYGTETNEVLLLIIMILCFLFMRSRILHSFIK